MKRIGLISDTHSYLHPQTFKIFKNCDEIWHAGDIGDVKIIDKINNFKPLRAVYGNIDSHEIRKICPKNQRFFCEEVDVWITHIGGYPNKYAKNIKEEIQNNPPKLFISGHSHILKVMYDDKLKLLHINPGGAGKYGIHKVITMIRFTINKTQIENLEVIELPKN